MLDARVAALRRRSYDDFRRMMGSVRRSYFGGRLKIVEDDVGELHRAEGPSGAVYHFNTEAWWDAGATS